MVAFLTPCLILGGAFRKRPSEGHQMIAYVDMTILVWSYPAVAPEFSHSLTLI